MNIKWYVKGHNFKKDGSRRKWNALFMGVTRSGSTGTQCKVIDLDIQEERWLSLKSFTGTINEKEYRSGKRVDGKMLFDE